MKDVEIKRNFIDKNIYIPYALEIEAENIPYDEGVRVLRHKIDDKWKIGIDRSLKDGGIELSSPVLPNDKDSILRLKKIASTLCHLDATFANASLQLNFDAFDFTSDDIIYLLKLFSIYQNVIYRYSTGIDECLRVSAFDYAVPLAQLFRDKYNMNAIKEESYKRFKNNKTFSLSLKTLTRVISDPVCVIEFRTPNGSYDFNLWMNYIIFFSSFLKVVKSKKYDREYIDYVFDREVFADSVEELLAIYEDKAVELANLIYQSNEEKNYFYCQYFEKKVLTR